MSCTENVILSTRPLKEGEKEEEVWKEIYGFEGGYYWVSIVGNVKSKDEVLEQRTEKSGHKYVTIVYLGRTYRCRVHRLVAETFLEYDEERNVVDHIDRNPGNNKVTNLRWVTHQENCWNQNARGNKTGYKHVSKMGNKYYATITRKFGPYNTAEEAHKAALDYLEKFDPAYKQYAHLGYNSAAYKKEINK
jgi:hypothetical protein